MIAAAIPDFGKELTGYRDSSTPLLHSQQNILKNQDEINKEVDIFIKSATDFLNSIYNNILTAEDPEVNRRIPRVQEMVAVIDGMKSSISEINKSILSGEPIGRDTVSATLSNIQSTLERLYNQSKVAEKKS